MPALHVDSRSGPGRGLWRGGDRSAREQLGFLGDEAAVQRLAADPERWARFVEQEVRITREPGVVDGGTHILFAAVQSPPRSRTSFQAAPRALAERATSLRSSRVSPRRGSPRHSACRRARGSRSRARRGTEAARTRARPGSSHTTAACSPVIVVIVVIVGLLTLGADPVFGLLPTSHRKPTEPRWLSVQPTGQPCGTSCCSDQVLPSGSLNVTNRPHGWSSTSLASTPSVISSSRAPRHPRPRTGGPAGSQAPSR